MSGGGHGVAKMDDGDSKGWVVLAESACIVYGMVTTGKSGIFGKRSLELMLCAQK